MIKLLIFDLDGTLFDTAKGITSAFNNLLHERGEQPVTHELVSSFIGTGLKDLLKQMDTSLQHRLGDIKILEQDFHRHYRAVFLQQSYIYPHIESFLRSWPEKLAVVSNKSEYYVRELLLHKELRGLDWIRIIGGDTFEEKKPHPLPVREAIKSAKVALEETVIVGDGLPDVQVAINAGIRSIAVDFGYSPVSELIAHGAHAVISDYRELPTAIAQF